MRLIPFRESDSVVAFHGRGKLLDGRYDAV